MVNIWATWCAPCIEEMPSMERLYRELHSTGLEIMAVSVDAEIGQVDRSRNQVGGDIRAFGDSLGLTFPLFHDSSGSIEDLYKTSGVPETFVIGRDGVIYKKVAGATDWDAPEHKEVQAHAAATAYERVQNVQQHLKKQYHQGKVKKAASSQEPSRDGFENHQWKQDQEGTFAGRTTY